MSESLLFVIALPAEAKPLIRHFQLERQLPERGFPVYCNGHVALIQSGIGKINAAAAVAHLAARVERPAEALWVNLGIAGHPELDIGSLAAVVKITDQGSGRSIYPVQLTRSTLVKSALTTVDAVSRTYPEATLLDMEAAGFAQAATRYTTLERIQSFKVVSDNCHEHLAEIRPATVSDWIDRQLPELLQALNELQQLLDTRSHDELHPEFSLYLAQWHFTATRQSQLKDLLDRWRVLEPAASHHPRQFSSCRDAGALMAALRERVNAIPYTFSA